MAVSTTKEEFKQRCLRRLGHPNVLVTVTEEQLDDCVDDALSYWWDYHHDGTEKQYYKHQLVADDFTNRYITLPENIMGVINMFPINSTYNTGGMFNIRYQLALNDLYSFINISVVPYYMTMQHLRLLEEIFVGKQPIRFNRHKNRAYLDFDWAKVAIGDYIILEAYEIIDPDVYTDVWKDRWLLQYCTALIKRTWGANVKNYDELELLNGMRTNGQKLYDEAIIEISELEHEMVHSYSLPVMDMIG